MLALTFSTVGVEFGPNVSGDIVGILDVDGGAASTFDATQFDKKNQDLLSNLSLDRIEI